MGNSRDHNWAIPAIVDRQRLLAYWNGHGMTRGRYRPEPGSRYVRHRLCVSQLYIDARVAADTGDIELLDFDVEPACWRTYVTGFGGQLLIKPDAYVRVGSGAYEDRFFVEVDLASESRPVIAHKIRAYVDYYRSGQEQADSGVFPRVLLLTATAARKAVLVDICSRLPAEVWQLFTVGLLPDGAGLFAELLNTDSAEDQMIGGAS